MASHTPGPWEITGPAIQASYGDRKMIAHMIWPSLSDIRREVDLSDEDLSNLRLLAAVPELLAALKQCRFELISLYHGDCDMEHAEKHSAGLRLANAALVKAEVL